MEHSPEKALKEQEFVALAKAYENASEELNLLRDKLTAAMTDLGLDQYAQDSATNVVYKIFKPQGTFIYYKDIDYKRTALAGEKGGVVLSKKEAQEAGFIL